MAPYNNNNRPNWKLWTWTLYELFTLGRTVMGIPNKIIVDTARGLRGYVDVEKIRWDPSYFRADRFDAGSKPF